ncbi:MAG: hypothetical protein GQ572_02005 [Gammaproteobacteria bacterium]|jgi:uncharacterized protein YaaN involved in tellurite resistance|nr:hypothetical protein [Gammaproteobacteria bacterium]
MTNKEKKFIDELEIFRSEAQSGAQYLYGLLSFNSIVGEKKKTRDAVNRTPLFWNSAMGAFQTSFFIVLGRIFDQKSPHNIDRLIKTAQDNISIFSSNALKKRKLNDSDNAHEWIDDYMKSVYVPTAKDFRELRKKINIYRKIYKSNYKDIRHKIYAHKQVTDAEDVQKLFSKTNFRELQKVFVFVNALYEALWQLYNNGRKPVLRRMRYSVKSMQRARKPEWQSQTVQERMVAEVQDCLSYLTSHAQQGAQLGRRKKRRAR